MVKQVRVIPAKNEGYWIECVYEVEQEHHDLDVNNIMSIDLGMNDLMTICDNLGNQPISMSGSEAKKINQWYNKEMARLKSDKARSNPRLAELQRKREPGLSVDEWRELRELLSDTKQMKTITEKRNRRINKIFHVASRKAIDIAISRKIGKITIGHNPGQKQNLDNGKKFNQNFGMLPIFKLVSMLSYKSELAGIEFNDDTEEFTSKASFKDNDAIPDRKKVRKKTNGHSDVTFSGKRVKRGLYISANGTQVHADVNAAYNIMRKACPEALGLNGAGTRLYPKRVNINPG